jgi:hypothetical protein
MRITDLHVGMRVAHPQHGAGIVKGITEQAAQVQFDAGAKTLDASALTVDGTAAMVPVDAGTMPLASLIREAVLEAAQAMQQGQERSQELVDQLGLRWRDGTLIMRPSDAKLQPKELPLERFFHKVVMVRDNLRLLEQKLNGHAGLSDAEKVDLQQYITRCYGSLTSFNILFKEKRDQFEGSGA